MTSLANVLGDPKVWIPALALLVSLISVFLSWRSSKIARRALAISEGQEKRRQPQLGIYLANGYRQLTSNGQLFGFLVSITNPTDINNSIARAELQITYLLEKDVETICRLQHNPAVGESVSHNALQAAAILSLPVRIDAHQTVSGWFLFALDNQVIGKGSVDSHRLILEDTHGVSTSSNPIPVRQWLNEGKMERDTTSPSS
jgi:hypothetical protein